MKFSIGWPHFDQRTPDGRLRGEMTEVRDGTGPGGFPVRAAKVYNNQPTPCPAGWAAAMPTGRV